MSCLKDFETLKKTKEFSYIYKTSKKFHTQSFLIFYDKNSNRKKVGFTASKKVGNAVERNFAKRRMRSIFLEKKDYLSNGVFVIVAKADILDIDFKKLKKDFNYSLKRLNAVQII